jgi:lipoic acid synthetase
VAQGHVRLPEWLKVKHHHGRLHRMKRRLRGHGLATVCEEARCPNKPECFEKPTATFMILGSTCTRNCGFCSVDASRPGPPDPEEPARVAQAAREMGLRYVVVTSVTRDDLSDGGAAHFASTIRALRAELPNARIEVLTPDFRGDADALDVVFAATPDVFNHNVETVPRLYSEVRPQAVYRRSLEVLHRASSAAPGMATKSGLMLGLGETYDEVVEVFRDLREAGCTMLTVGQYLRPTARNLPVREYAHPDAFERLRLDALEMGFGFVASAPLVRSSMNAEEMYEGIKEEQHV